ncbi:hypothetical protein CKO25_14850 [Thiocapsa imhoffii]|uniref:Ankyrin repeat domain-containing protein n=1 Tax=Thiocapsa imhoffii TaxID=382777 RepID=A0A9X1B9I5_9GAMM|nr:ankyrin repeat domain-containing protein [Thiocapsa imhoffii]MBK1645902.1 hypothetical protein [Thiocapsa imhoffii]
MNKTLLLLIPVLTLLLSACQPSGSSEEHTEALLEIAERGDLTALNALLKPNTQVNVRDSCDWTPLMKAALQGHAPVVARLLDAGAAIDAQDNGGYTAMMLAASNNHAAIVATLLEHGAMIDHQEATKGWTALGWAAGKGHVETVELLLQQGADRTLKDFDGLTPAEHARAAGHETLAERLSPSGA